MLQLAHVCIGSQRKACPLCARVSDCRYVIDRTNGGQAMVVCRECATRVVTDAISAVHWEPET